MLGSKDRSSAQFLRLWRLLLPPAGWSPGSPRLGSSLTELWPLLKKLPSLTSRLFAFLRLWVLSKLSNCILFFAIFCEDPVIATSLR
jgi:hypothetical protein